MYPASFEYHRPGSVEEAVGLLTRYKDDAKVVAGGHSLIPMMKLRLAQPKHLVDIRRIGGLSGVREEGGTIAIGALTTHYTIESNAALKGKCAILPEAGAMIGSVSGGCIEGAVVLEAQAAIKDGKPRLLEFGVSDEDAWAVGLACGGRVQVYVEPVE